MALFFCTLHYISSDFRIFGWVHFAIMAAIPAAAFALAPLARRHPRAVRMTLGWALLVNELIWYWYKIATEGWRFPQGMPLQLCDLSLWATIVALLTLHPLAVETAYFAGVGGASQAVITPELWAPAWSYPTAYFFAAHGGLIIGILTLLIADVVHLRKGAIWRGFAAANAWMLFVGAFNAVFHTNYMYLCRKPANATILDALGPWPWYILGGEALTLAVFGLLRLAAMLFPAR